jgi:hypothetical protein
MVSGSISTALTNNLYKIKINKLKKISICITKTIEPVQSQTRDVASIKWTIPRKGQCHLQGKEWTAIQTLRESQFHLHLALPRGLFPHGIPNQNHSFVSIPYVWKYANKRMAHVTHCVSHYSLIFSDFYLLKR